MNLTNLFFGKSTYKRLKFMNCLAFILSAVAVPISSVVEGGGGGGTKAEQEAKEALVKEIENQVKSLLKDQKSGLVSREDFEKELGLLKAKDADTVINAFKTEMLKTVAEQGKKIKELEERGAGSPDKIKTLKDAMDEFVKSPIFEEYKKSGFRGTSAKMAVKGVNIVGSYSGYATSVPLTGVSGVVVDEPYQMRRLNVRDVLRKGVTTLPQIVHQKVTDWVNTITTATEVATLTEWTFAMSEAITAKKRIGGFIDLSKDMLESLDYVVSTVLAQLPMKLYFKEDNLILNGAGAGADPVGLFYAALDLNLYFTQATVALSSVATFNGGTQTLLTFAADHRISDGWTLTIANSTNYNGAYTPIVHTKTKVVLDIAYNAESTAAWTYIAQNPFYHAIEIPTLADVISAAVPVLQMGEYRATAILLNPWDAAVAERAKDTTGQPLREFVRTNGVLSFNGIPIIETTAVPSDKMYIMDGNLGTTLYQYRDIEIYMTDDVTYAKTNQVCVIIEEHICLPIFNQYAFRKVDITDAITALTKP